VRIHVLARARRAAVSAVIASGFVMASVVPVYFVWLMPEVFNFSLLFLAYFCWLYKEGCGPGPDPRRMQWLWCGRSGGKRRRGRAPRGWSTFSKVTNAFLFAPDRGLATLAQLPARRREDAQIIATVAVFTLIAAGLFGITKLISGEWSYQGGVRETYSVEFPFQNDVAKQELGQSSSREGSTSTASSIPARSRRTSPTISSTFFIGRHTGLLGYFFPAVFAMIAFSARAATAPGLAVLVLACGTAAGSHLHRRHALHLERRRCRESILLRRIRRDAVRAATGSVAHRRFTEWAVGSFFVAPMVLNPFVASFHPADIRQEWTIAGAARRADAGPTIFR
jgi:hypothetical protein